MGTGFLHHATSILSVKHGMSFHFNFSTQPIIALVAGLLILIRPKLLNFVVAGYLIIVGLLGLFNLHW